MFHNMYNNNKLFSNIFFFHFFSSRKIECPAHITLRAAADGKSLEVKSFNNTHNHEISKVILTFSRFYIVLLHLQGSMT